MELVSKFFTFHLKYFLISDGQDLAITSFLDPKLSISKVLLENVKVYNIEFE